MKNSLIEHLHFPQIKELTIELFEYIEIAYGIREAEGKFVDYFVNVLKKSYGHMNFEQLEDAFYRNASGALDTFLPKVGMRADNKVMKFNIPDLTKIINAFCKYLGIEKNDTNLEKKVFTEEEKKAIHLAYVNGLIEAFDIYKKDKKKRISITTPLYTSIFLMKLDLIKKSEINFPDSKLNENIGRKTKNKKVSSNEKLIYKCFDKIIEENKHLREFIKDVGEMPF